MRSCGPLAERSSPRALRALVLLCAGVLAGCDLATVRRLDPATGKAIVEEERRAFDAGTFVAESWESRIVPTVRERAVPLARLRQELAADRAAAEERYGNRPGSGSASFLVTGRARVLAVDTTSRAGVATLDLEPFDGAADAQLQIGPVFRGTALRDALPFIRFDDFTNQMEYASVSRLLHERVAGTVLGSVDRATLGGRVILFHGALTDGSEPPLITPAIVQVEG
jgi:predicted lipoprotein